MQHLLGLRKLAAWCITNAHYRQSVLLLKLLPFLIVSQMRREDGCCIKRIMNAEVYGRGSRGRQKKRWRDKIQEDLKMLKLKKEDADDRNKWRRRIRVADSSPRTD